MDRRCLACGKGGGGAELTPDAQRFLKSYRKFEKAVREYADESERIHQLADPVVAHGLPRWWLKRINDISGHLAGDSVLRAVADEVRRIAGPMELPCRLGGDEFALVLRVADEGELANRALGLLASVRALRLPSLREHALTISVGGAFCADPGGWSAWYSQADMVLYEAKTSGGDRWRLAL